MGRKRKKGIISEASAKIMQTPVAVKEGYGLALLKTDKLIKGEIMTGHTGSAYGLFSAMFFNPEKKFGFVVISNGCDPRYSDDNNTTINKVINILYRSFIIH